jgi:biopolymer transport protein ExbB
MDLSVVEALRTYFVQGGYVMWPLVVCTLVLWYALGYRYLTLQRGSSRALTELIQVSMTGRKKAPSGIMDGACDLAVRIADGARGDLRLLLDDAFAEVRHELSRGKTAIGSIVAVAPLLGLLGTVTGMIETFDSMADMSFFSQSGGIAGGIAEALFTTQMGLVVAVPGVILGRMLDRRETKLDDELERLKDFMCAEAKVRASLFPPP